MITKKLNFKDSVLKTILETLEKEKSSFLEDVIIENVSGFSDIKNLHEDNPFLVEPGTYSTSQGFVDSIEFNICLKGKKTVLARVRGRSLYDSFKKAIEIYSYLLIKWAAYQSEYLIEDLSPASEVEESVEENDVEAIQRSISQLSGDI